MPGTWQESRLWASLVAVVGVQLLAAVAVGSLHRFDKLLKRTLPYVVSVAVGVLLATGMAHLLPEAVEALGNGVGVWLTVVLTMLVLYGFERVFHLVSGVNAEPLQEFEPEHHDCEALHGGHGHSHGASKPATLLLGAVTHSLVDGTSVAAAFAVDARVGWVTALAVGLHEIPHRLGDFALLVHMGVKRGRAAVLAVAAGMSSLLGWAIVAMLGEHGGREVAWLLPVSAGSFLYISLVDLLPELGSERKPVKVVLQLVCLAFGVALAIGLTRIPGA
ncbi:MAG: ZIP family metal transporter [Acidobacteriota bacterium]